VIFEKPAQSSHKIAPTGENSPNPVTLKQSLLFKSFSKGAIFIDGSKIVAPNLAAVGNFFWLGTFLLGNFFCRETKGKMYRVYCIDKMPNLFSPIYS
jgi:hypothetical protein